MSLSRIIFAVNKFFKGINRGLILKTTGSGCESDSYRYIVSKKFGYQSIFLMDSMNMYFCINPFSV